ncbi:MAG: peptidoglycan editing factor PgeF [Firmicutes bacterium]|nr:peptidoglycan editing factor PgeF [Bacillota bacterium]
MLQSRTWQVNEDAGVIYLTIPAFTKTGMVRHGFSTRVGGLSPSPFGMNLSISSEDDPRNVRLNYERMAYVLESYTGNMVVSAQVHGTDILRVGVMDRGKGVTIPREMEAIDGLVTDQSQVCLVTIHADCVPLFFLDPVHRAIGLAHAGWRGTLDQIGSKMVARMQSEFESKPEDLLAAIGPSIGPCCFEVGADVAEGFAARYQGQPDIVRAAGTPGKYMVDLWEANRLTLTGAGVLPDRITVTDICTCCNADIFHSYRKTRTPGRMAAFLELI